MVEMRFDMRIRISILSWILLLAACEVFSSWWVWGSIPTDTIGVSYATAWSYIGEHFLLWLACLGALAAGLRVIFTRTFWTRNFSIGHYILAIGVLILLEVVSSAYRWYLAVQDGSRFPWWKGGFGTYFGARLVPLLVAFGLGSCAVLWRGRIQKASLITKPNQ